MPTYSSRSSRSATVACGSRCRTIARLFVPSPMRFHASIATSFALASLPAYSCRPVARPIVRSYVVPRGVTGFSRSPSRAASNAPWSMPMVSGNSFM